MTWHDKGWRGVHVVHEIMFGGQNKKNKRKRRENKKKERRTSEIRIFVTKI